LGYTPALCVPELAARGLTQCVYSREYGELLSACAVREGVTLDVHLKIDTGMGRIGFAMHGEADAATVSDMADVCALPGLRVRGAFTHFAVADDGEAGEAFSRRQYDLFARAMAALEQRGIVIECKHCANSAALSDYKNYHMDMVRAGIVLYGLQPSAELRTPLELRPAMTLKSVVSHVKTLREGDSVSYGRTFVAKQDMKIATVPIGYADGYRRASSENGATLLIRGKRCPIVGRVCMDQLMVDVSELP
jgi:alanine racemase